MCRLLHRLSCYMLLGLLMAGCARPSAPPTTPRSAKQSGGIAAAREQGMRAAQEALVADRLVLKEWPPLPAPAWHGAYIQMLQERCNVGYEVLSLPKDADESEFRAEVAGWNETMLTEIRRRCGDDIIQKLQAEAEVSWQKSSASAAPSTPSSPASDQTADPE